MRKIFNKVLAGITTVALVATLLVGINVTDSVKADDTVALANWSFMQGGQYNPSELGNEGYIGSVTMNGTNEVISGWLKGNGGEPSEDDPTSNPSFKQKQTATQASTGFAIGIENTGWDAQWKKLTGYPTDRMNPWSIQAMMEDVTIEPGHIYTVSFKARATKNKYGYVAFGCDVEGTAPYGEDVVAGDSSIITLGTTDQTFTYTFTNWVSATKLSTTLMFGAFSAQYDYDGNDVSDIVTTTETQWSGTVFVSDFTITDCGKNEEFTTAPPKETEAPTAGNNNGGSTVTKPTTAAPTVTTAAPTVKKLAKVTNVKAKNNKKKTLKITWKKVANAKTYQVKVGNKTYNTKKATLTVKKLKKGKKYTIRVRAKAAGYKIGAWSKKINVKVKK